MHTVSMCICTYVLWCKLLYYIMYTLLKGTVNTVHPGIVEALFTLHIYHESTRMVMNARSDRTHAQLLMCQITLSSMHPV